MKNIYESYVENLCNNCRNKNKNLCNIRRTIKGTLKCIYYEKENKLEGYKDQTKMTITANRKKPIMKGIDKWKS